MTSVIAVCERERTFSYCIIIAPIELDTFRPVLETYQKDSTERSSETFILVYVYVCVCVCVVFN